MSTAATTRVEDVLEGKLAKARLGQSPSAKKIWIDLENSPHVPFFKPIIHELEQRGHRVIVTARDCFQVCGLADLFQLDYKPIGRHYGKNRLAKIAGLGVRVLQMSPLALTERPDLAVSHGSRSLFLLSSMLRIPTLTIMDYEHTAWFNLFKPTWVMAPNIVPQESACAMGVGPERLLRYPGIKEDVYAPSFQPDPETRARLGISSNDVMITLRPPASEAHYHNPESEQLLHAVFAMVSERRDIRVVLVPRTPKQGNEIRAEWPQLFEHKRVMIPEQVVDGLDLIWASDLVISGGGTMNREAAALGVPVYSIFRGKIGAIDRYLADESRLVLLESADDVKHKIQAVRRQVAGKRPAGTQVPALDAIVENIVAILDSRINPAGAVRD